MMQDVLQRVGREFVTASEGSLANHPLANYLRKDAAQEVRDAISRPDLRVVGAPGQGNWAMCRGSRPLRSSRQLP